MMRKAVGVLLVAVLFFVAACSDAPSAPQATVEPQATDLTLVQASSDIHWVRGCPAIGPLTVLAIAIISHNNEDMRSVVARLGDLNEDVRARRQARIKERAHALVEFLLKRYQAGKFRGTDAQFAALINAIYCFAGIDIDIETPKNTELILPSDQPQVVVATNGQAGVQLPANPVSEPTLLTIEQVTTPPTNGGFLQTKLDQYPGFLLVTKQSENDAPLAKPVVVAVCASGVIPQAVRDRLRLGHGKSTGFEIAAPGNGSFLSCPNQVAEAAPASGWGRVAELLMPAQVVAFQQEFGGGVGGTVTEFSPFAPVDPQLEFGGGVGGTVTEFTRVAPSAAPMTSAPKKGAKSSPATIAPSVVLDPCAYGPPGAPLSAACVPSIQVTTRLGTVLSNVPVSWNVTAGGGSIAPKTNACGAFGTTASTLTNAAGRAGICWTLGTPGLNKVTATPSAGGDAPAGVSFTPTNAEFQVTAVSGPPAGIVKVLGDEQTAPAGSVVPVAPKVRVIDAYGYPVSGVRVYWVAIGGVGSVTPADPSYVLTDASGYATASWMLAAGSNQLRAAIYDPDHFWVIFNATGNVP